MPFCLVEVSISLSVVMSWLVFSNVWLDLSWHVSVGVFITGQMSAITW